MKAFILTAVPVEYNAVMTYLTTFKEGNTRSGMVYIKGTYIGQNKKKVTVYLMQQNSMGNIDAANVALDVVASFKIDLALFVGIAGGVKDVSLGDVVFARKIYGYELQKVVEGKSLPRPELGNSSQRLTSRAIYEANHEKWHALIQGDGNGAKPKAICGNLASGEKVIASTRSPIYKFLKTHYTDTQAVEMEGLGFMKGLQFAGFHQAGIIRGISDLLNKKEETDAAGNQELASKHAAAFAFNLLEKFIVKKAPAAKKKTKKQSKTVCRFLWEIEFEGDFDKTTSLAIDRLMGQLARKVKTSDPKLKTKQFSFKVIDKKKGSIVMRVAVNEDLNNALKALLKKNLADIHPQLLALKLNGPYVTLDTPPLKTKKATPAYKKGYSPAASPRKVSPPQNTQSREKEPNTLYMNVYIGNSKALRRLILGTPRELTGYLELEINRPPMKVIVKLTRSMNRTMRHLATFYLSLGQTGNIRHFAHVTEPTMVQKLSQNILVYFDTTTPRNIRKLALLQVISIGNSTINFTHIEQFRVENNPTHSLNAIGKKKR